MKAHPIAEQRTRRTPLGPLPSAWDIVRLKVVSSESTDRNTDLTYGRPDVLGVDNEAGLRPSERKLGDDFSRYKLIGKNQFAYNPMRLNVRSIGLWRQDRTQLVSPDYIVFGCDQERLDPEFLRLFMASAGWDRQIGQSGQGSIRIRYYFRHIGEFFIPLPPLPEQRAIARALRAVQQAKETRRRSAALERERKAALMENLFTHGTRGEATKQTEIGEMPESWDICSLGSIAEVDYGLTVNASRRKSADLAPYLAVANVTRGTIKLDNVKEIGVLEGDVERYRLQKGDVLLIEGNGNPNLLGSAAIWNAELPFMLHQNHLIRARLDQSRAVPEWVMCYLNSDDGRRQLLGKAKTSSGLHSINSRLIGGLQIPLPPIVEQKAVTNLLRSCDPLIAALERESALLDELFRALLEELMTGRLRVKDELSIP